jgi:hypothetical protein
MDPVRLIIFVAFFLLFLLVVRRMFSSSQPYHGHVPPDPPDFSWKQEPDLSNELTAIGAELPFPINLPPVEEREDGSFNRPNILNYYFESTDLVRGPENSSDFCDRFFIQFQSPDEQFTWTVEYTIATPAGLQSLLSSERQESLLFSGSLIVVSTWNMAAIMTAVMDDVMDKHEVPLQPRAIREYPGQP